MKINSLFSQSECFGPLSVCFFWWAVHNWEAGRWIYSALKSLWGCDVHDFSFGLFDWIWFDLFNNDLKQTQSCQRQLIHIQGKLSRIKHTKKPQDYFHFGPIYA